MFARRFATIPWSVGRRVAPWAGRQVKDKIVGNDGDHTTPNGAGSSASTGDAGERSATRE